MPTIEPRVVEGGVECQAYIHDREGSADMELDRSWVVYLDVHYHFWQKEPKLLDKKL